MTQKLINKVAIVVGASRGIGAATGEALAAEGAYVLLAAPAPETCEPIAEKIRASGGQAEAHDCDAVNSDQVSALVKQAVERRGRIDIMINCAGIMGPVALVEDCDPQAWAQGIMVNMVGAFNGCRAALPYFRKAGQGVLINMSTGAAFHPLKGWSAYCSSKAGLLMLSKIISAEVAGSGIRVFSFQPGMVNTALGRQSMKIDINQVTKYNPDTFAPPTEPARALTWLCTDEAADLAGTEVSITDPDFRKRAGL